MSEFSTDRVTGLDAQPRFLFAYSYWDAIPALLGVLHLLYIIAWFLIFPHAPLWISILMGVIYAISISWNINGISHNFIHNPYFKSAALNRIFSFVESLSCGFSQVFYECVHRRHHMGNSDRPDEHGQVIDWLSIYKHGHDGQAENVWTYTFLGYFRDDVAQTYREIKKISVREARWGVIEIITTICAGISMFILNWKFGLLFLGSYYLGHCLSQLNGYYKHYGADPDEPIAWGVSSYSKLYNWIWFNNGFHAEHHYRPRMHWTKMSALHEEIREQQEEAGVRVIKPPHALGFLDPSLPRRDETGAPHADVLPQQTRQTS